MLRPPRWLKTLLLPTWNEAHRLVWRVGEYADAIRRGRFERCVICGRFAPILHRRRVIPPRLEGLWGLSPREAEALARKESSDCARCGAKLRARRLARVLLDTFPVDSPPTPALSVEAWSCTPEARDLRVAELNLIDGLHTPLSRLPSLAYSEFLADVEPGSTVEGVRCEDLTRLTYPADSFDLILTSETLEHVPDLAAALAEIRRVLKPGGWHLFTVPIRPCIPETFARTIVRPDGSLDHRHPLLCHPGGNVGYPVFTEFGADLPTILDRAGFATTLYFGPTTEDDLAQVFACQKRRSAKERIEC